ncbi:MAG: adenylate/guanylate cyclase domain-containing protein [Cyanobacteria bacterium J06560_6]
MRKNAKNAERGSLQQFFWQWRGVLVAAPAVAVLVILLRFLGLFQVWEWAAFDQYMRLRPSEPLDSRVVIVGLDEADLQELNQAVVNDQVYAELLKKLRSQSPRAIGLDIYRNLPMDPGHQELVEVFNTTPSLIGIRKVVGEAGISSVPPPPALAEKGQVAANDIVVDADNTIRRGLISVQAPDGETVYSLSLYLSLLYLDAEGIGPEMLEDDAWKLGKTTFSPLSSNYGGYVRTDAAGYQLLINYRGPQRTFEIVSFSDILQERVPQDWAKDKVVLIGAVSESFKDSFYTPYRGGILSLPETMSGVEVHANLTSQIIGAAMDDRPLIKSWSEPVEWGWILLWSGTGAMVVWLCSHTGPYLPYRWQRSGLILGAIATLASSTYIPFLYGWWLPVVPAALAMAGAATAVTAYLAYTAIGIRRTFGRYLSAEIVTALLEHPEGQRMGGERRKITILTSDLRGFTAISERLPPEMVIKVLNFYFEYMADVISRHSGTIDELMGDGILVLFGAPIRREDDAKRAIACAVAMQLAMSEVNQTIQEWGLAPLEMGIGIHTGEVVVGNIGSEKRTKYGVVGSPVNLTYRIESFTTGGQLLISEETLAAADGLAQIRGQREVRPKGIAQPITIYDVGGVGAPYNLVLPQEEEVFYPLAQPVAVLFNVVSGKHMDGPLFSGRLVQLSKKGALLQVAAAEQSLICSLSNLKLNFLANTSDDANHLGEDFYAKVLEKSAAVSEVDPTVLHLRFTGRSGAIAAQLDRLYQSIS